jgi:hypothetical protein
MLRLIVAAAAAVLLGGCNMMSCAGDAGGRSGAADCGIHTTFFAAVTAKPHPRALAKS